jgi:hypothetical protein
VRHSAAWTARHGGKLAAFPSRHKIVWNVLNFKNACAAKLSESMRGILFKKFDRKSPVYGHFPIQKLAH